MQGAHFQDLITMRYADVLLMQSELKEDAAGINQVRARAGLAPIPGYSLELLQRERRHELCFEGRRWADIRRWGIAEEMLDKKNGVTIWNKGERTKMTDGKYVERYRATNGFSRFRKLRLTYQQVCWNRIPVGMMRVQTLVDGISNNLKLEYNEKDNDILVAVAGFFVVCCLRPYRRQRRNDGQYYA